MNKYIFCFNDILGTTLNEKNGTYFNRTIIIVHYYLVKYSDVYKRNLKSIGWVELNDPKDLLATNDEGITVDNIVCAQADPNPTVFEAESDEKAIEYYNTFIELCKLHFSDVFSKRTN